MTIHINKAALRRQAVFWAVVLAVFIGFVYVFRGILLPFVAGMALAYFLDPVADRLERIGLSRLMATVTILVMFLLIFALALIIIVPVLISQTSDFLQRFPEYLTRLQELITSPDLDILPAWAANQLTDIRSSFGQMLTEGAGLIGTLFQQIWDSGMAIVNIVALMLVTPVVTFYLLLDWDRMIAKVDSWLPRDHVGTVRDIAEDMNRAIAGFVRGQGSVCLILGVFYAVGLSLAGLNFGLLIGLFAGLISFIPYVGSLVGLLLSIGVALVQFWPDYLMIAIIAAIFFAGQFIEGNILQPKLVGSSVGIHPVWLMFALFAFGSLFGFVGMLIAVPAAAAIGVLVRFALRRYLDSQLYYGHDVEAEAAAAADTAPPDIANRSAADRNDPG